MRLLLSASLWLGIPVVDTNPRFLVANSLRAPGVLALLYFSYFLVPFFMVVFHFFFFFVFERGFPPSEVGGDWLQRGLHAVPSRLSWHPTASLTLSPTTTAAYSEVSADPPPLSSTFPPLTPSHLLSDSYFHFSPFDQKHIFGEPIYPKLQQLDTDHKGLWVFLMEERYNGILTTNIHYLVKLCALSVRIRAQRLHVTGRFTGTWQYNKRARRRKTY